jgi:hypothetical protein
MPPKAKKGAAKSGPAKKAAKKKAAVPVAEPEDSSTDSEPFVSDDEHAEAEESEIEIDEDDAALPAAPADDGDVAGDGAELHDSPEDVLERVVGAIAAEQDKVDDKKSDAPPRDVHGIGDSYLIPQTEFADELTYDDEFLAEDIKAFHALVMARGVPGPRGSTWEAKADVKTDPWTEYGENKPTMPVRQNIDGEQKWLTPKKWIKKKEEWIAKINKVGFEHERLKKFAVIWREIEDEELIARHRYGHYLPPGDIKETQPPLLGHAKESLKADKASLVRSDEFVKKFWDDITMNIKFAKCTKKTSVWTCFEACVIEFVRSDVDAKRTIEAVHNICLATSWTVTTRQNKRFGTVRGNYVVRNKGKGGQLWSEAFHDEFIVKRRLLSDVQLTIKQGQYRREKIRRKLRLRIDVPFQAVVKAVDYGVERWILPMLREDLPPYDDEWPQMIAWCSLVCGARPIEIAHLSTFRPITQEQVESWENTITTLDEALLAKRATKVERIRYNKMVQLYRMGNLVHNFYIWQTGLAKSKKSHGDKHKRVNIAYDLGVWKPLLGPYAADVIIDFIENVIRPRVQRAIQSLPKFAGRDLHDIPNTEFSSFISRKNKHVMEMFFPQLAADNRDQLEARGRGLRAYDMRAIYGNASYALWGESSMSQQIWLSRVLGHSMTDIDTANHYASFRVTLNPLVLMPPNWDAAMEQLARMYVDFQNFIAERYAEIAAMVNKLETAGGGDERNPLLAFKIPRNTPLGDRRDDMVQNVMEALRINGITATDRELRRYGFNRAERAAYRTKKRRRAEPVEAAGPS